MVTPIHITPAALNDVAFTFLEQYAECKISDMVALTKIDVELAIVGIPFDQKEWLDLMEPIMMNPTEGLNSIKNAWQLMQVKMNPLLEDPTAWQYNFDEWRTVFDQVFKASHEGTTIEVVRAAMTEHGVLDHPSVHDLSLQPSSLANVSHTFPSTQASSQLHKTIHKGNVEGLNAHAYRSPVHKAEAGMDVDVGLIELRIYTIELPTRFVLEHLKHGGSSCQTFQSVPRWIFVEACNPLEVQLSLPPLHTDLVKEIMQIPSEQMWSVTKPCDIPVCSWVHVLFGIFKNDIAYVLSIKDDSIETLIVPRSLPYYSGTYNPVDGHSLFDIELVREHDFEVIISTNDRGHAIAYCGRREYHSGCYHIYFLKSRVKVLEFSAGTSIKVIAGLNCGFQGMVISRIDDMFLLQGNDQQVWHDPLANENCLQPGDLVHVISGPHKGLCITLHYYSSHEILVTSSMIQQKGTDDLGDKGKSKAQEPKVTRGDGDGNGNEDSDLMQVSISMDDAIVIPLPTLQFSKERGYDVTVGDHVQVVHSPAVGVEGPVRTVDLTTRHLTVLSEDGLWHNVPISFCTKLQDYSLCDVECQVSHEVWIISSPSKGYRGTLQSVGRTTCKVAIHSGIMQLRHTAVITKSGMLLSGTPLDPTRMVAFIALCQTSFIQTAPPPHQTTPPPSPPIANPSVKPGPSSSAYNSWVVHPNDVTSQHSDEMEQQKADYSCIPWLFNDAFCDYTMWHVCLRVSLSYNRGSLQKQVVRTMAPNHFSTVTQGCCLAPPGHVSVTMTSSMVKKCQSKKAPKGVELEDGTKLSFGDTGAPIEAAKMSNF
ncbi:hypothetical protein EV401DRAFT_1892860 [Pisolithus croceorrhizus]|nr:hypothetical protein EV401DRAFT_1892860 [Pisolithus croceorrhizus]